MTDFNGKINAKGAETKALIEDKGGGNIFNSSLDPPLETIKYKSLLVESIVDPPPKQIVQLSQTQIKSEVDPPPPTSFDKGGGFVEISSRKLP